MAAFHELDPGEPGEPADVLDVVRSYLALAIQLGAPAYNFGDHRGCYEVYACTARLLLRAVDGADEAKAILREGLRQTSTMNDVTQQAWTLRHVFDAILGKDCN